MSISLRAITSKKCSLRVSCYVVLCFAFEYDWDYCSSRTKSLFCWCLLPALELELERERAALAFRVINCAVPSFTACEQVLQLSAALRCPRCQSQLLLASLVATRLAHHSICVAAYRTVPLLLDSQFFCRPSQPSESLRDIQPRRMRGTLAHVEQYTQFSRQLRTFEPGTHDRWKYISTIDCL